MLVQRTFWQELIENSWKQKNIIWLMGVRRVGKTSLCQSMPNTEYFDCERPSVRQLMEDPESFLASQKNKRIVLDEIHHLDNPSQLLKLCADHYPDTKILATGSSTLGASAKFKDTLAGRKKEIWLSPLLLEEMQLWGNTNLQHRFLFGGFPSFFAQTELPEADFREWIDAYWAKDIQEMFKVGKRYSFQKFAELLLAQSGGQFEASKFAVPCEVSRQTISNYLEVLAETFVVHIVRPYSTHKANEIILAPKVYGMDTGFTCYAKGWRTLRQEDLGILWEHCVLNEIQAHLQQRTIHYWRNKQQHEIDFVIPNKNHGGITAIECKLNSSRATLNTSSLESMGKNIEAFRKLYPEGDNFIVCSDITASFTRKYNDLTLTFVNTSQLIKKLK